ncbi:MAG: SCO family protein [Ignavibacterium sp.]
MKNKKHFLVYSFYIFIAILSLNCQEKFPLNTDISKYSFSLVNQDGNDVNFPKQYLEKIIVMGFIFTNCPDICPMTTHNMQLIQSKIKEEKINNVQFLALSFDPDRDRPQILKNYVTIRNIDLDNWQFLTGDKKEVDSLLSVMNVVAIPSDTTYTEDKTPIYTFVHTDRISLIDKDGKLRKEYSGSKINIEEIVNDIKKL